MNANALGTAAPPCFPQACVARGAVSQVRCPPTGAPTDETLPTSVRQQAQHQIARHEWMPLRTVRLVLVLIRNARRTESRVLSPRHWLQVFRVDARRVAALVVQFDASRQWTIDRRPHGPVGVLHRATNGDLAVAFAGVRSSEQPAPGCLVHLDARQDFRNRLTDEAIGWHSAKMWHAGTLRQRRIA